MPQVSIYLRDEDKELLGKISEKENRSVSNTVATLIRKEIVAISTLPHPADAQAVPVIHVSK